MTWGVSSIFTILIAIASQTRPRFDAHKENMTVREDRVPMQYRMLNLSVGVLLSAMLHMPAAQADDERCAEPIATFASIAGPVEAAGASGNAWHSVHIDDRLCPGDRLRVGANSRAAVVLGILTVMRLDALSSLYVSGPK